MVSWFHKEKQLLKTAHQKPYKAGKDTSTIIQHSIDEQLRGQRNTYIILLLPSSNREYLRSTYVNCNKIGSIE